MSYAPDAAPQRGWFGRNWLWFVPLMLLMMLVLACGGCIVAGMLFGERFAAAAMQFMPEVQQGMTILNDNAEVREALGEPVEMDGLPTKMDQGFSGQTVTREMGFKVKGPKGSATVELDSETIGNSATIKRLEVTLPDGKKLDLTPTSAGEASPAEGESSDTEMEIEESSGAGSAEVEVDEAETTTSP